MVSFIYVSLLLLMLFVLFKSGIELKNNGGKLLSPSGISAILVYTFNEGLRFGRGVDYCNYWDFYQELSMGGESNRDFIYVSFCKLLISIGVPFQGLILLSSLMFIVATLFLMKNYKEILPYALPLFILFSMTNVENMIRWNLAFSFVLIGLSYQLRSDKWLDLRFLFFCIISATIHLAILPIPILFFTISKFERPLFNPFLTIAIYMALTFLFDSSFMLRFIDIVNMVALLSERFESYGNNAEYWLTGGYAGIERASSYPGLSNVLFFCFLVFLGYKIAKKSDNNIVFAYNLFIIGLFLLPIGRQIELVVRFYQPFFFFRGIMIAGIIYLMYIHKKIKCNTLILLMSMLLFINVGRKYFTAPIFGNPLKYLYVWDSGNRTIDEMHEMWLDELYKTASNE